MTAFYSPLSSFRIPRGAIVVLAVVGFVNYCSLATAADEKKAENKPPIFEKDVLPILKARCLRCHSGKNRKGGLDLSRRISILKGGDSGAAIRLAAAETSLLWAKISANKMPPQGPPLTAQEKGVIRTWINEGAKSDGADTEVDESSDDGDEYSADDRNHWSFKPPKRAQAPTVNNSLRVRNALDAFILKRLEDKGLTFSKEADRRTLVRRAFFALIGLPPTPQEVEQFLNNDEPDAYERLVEQLLASPHYGERWGRHWLDVAGYADTAGVLGSELPRPHIYRYRDYVVQAFNSDKPYDQFLQEQIAGDELYDYWTALKSKEPLPAKVIEGLIATGFLRCAPDASRPDFNTIKNVEAQYYYPTIDRTMEILFSATMGVTVQCAKCHSHKYDPIPQREYYRVQSILMTAFRPKKWIPFSERRIYEANESQQTAAKQFNEQLDKENADSKKAFQQTTDLFAKKLFEKRLSQVPANVRDVVKKAFHKKADERSEPEKQLVAKYKAKLQPTDANLTKALTEAFDDFKQAKQKLDAGVQSRERRKRYFPVIFALYDLPGEAKTPLLIRGDALTPGPLVEPGVLSALKVDEPFTLKPSDPKQAPTSGRRLAFARWMTQPSHPLSSRVMVNRLWMHHFGEGLVSTPEDFGKIGAAPSHPELLDWLAREFVESGWSIKHLHRLIMTSTTYRQTSQIDVQSKAAKVDPGNRLLWRQRLRRQEAEAIRDSILAVAGTLNVQMFGRAIPMARRPTGEVTTADGQDGTRRSIYLQVTRRNPLTILELFDQPVMETNCTRRINSTVSLQALALMNNDFLVEAASAFADRVRRESPEDPLGRAVELTFPRPLNEGEFKQLTNFLEAQTKRYQHVEENEPAKKTDTQTLRHRALADLCQMLLCTSEFVYVD